MTKYFLKTFGCAQNTADSERIKAYYWTKGIQPTSNWKKAQEVVINSCVVRESAENRVYGLINNIKKFNPNIKIILTGCLAGISKNKKIDRIDEIWPISKFEDFKPLRDKKKAALIPISSGCNNFCSYCIVPYARGREVSRDFKKIIKDADEAIKKGFKELVLIGQNVNSYKPSFPKLLEAIANKPWEKISFVSSNPWDFSDELIETIARYPNIDRLVHLPFQSGDDQILKKMNRNYTKKEYLKLIKKIKSKVKEVRFSTDIIVGFPGEDEKAFQNTVDVCQQVDFEIAYINKYSPRKGTVSAKLYPNDIPQSEKKRRWQVLEELVNKN